MSPTLTQSDNPWSFRPSPLAVIEARRGLESQVPQRLHGRRSHSFSALQRESVIAPRLSRRKRNGREIRSLQLVQRRPKMFGRECAGDPRRSPELRPLVSRFLGSSMARECEDRRLVVVHIRPGVADGAWCRACHAHVDALVAVHEVSSCCMVGQAHPAPDMLSLRVEIYRANTGTPADALSFAAPRLNCGFW